MHFLLVGPGALGCLLSSVITKGMGEHDQLTILDYNADRANHLTKEGIVYHLGRATGNVSGQRSLRPTSCLILLMW